MYTLTGTLIGGALHFFENFTVTGTGEQIVRSAYCFGVQHLADRLLLAHERRDSEGGLYLPKWLEGLARTAGATSETAILLEIPPLAPEFIDEPALATTVEVSADTILSGCLTRLLPLFASESPARKAGWVLDGIDLRYRYDYSGGRFARSGNDLRWDIHKTLGDDLGKWNLNLQQLRLAYTYLIGMSNEAARLDNFVTAYCAAAGNLQNEVKRRIFAQAAAQCRTIFSGVDEGVKLSVVEFMVAEAKERVAAEETEHASNSIPKVYEGSGGQAVAYDVVFGTSPDQNYTENVLKYAVAEHLVDLYMLGYLLCADANLKNVVIVVGQQHILTVRKFFEKYKGVVTVKKVWPPRSELDSKIAVAPSKLGDVEGYALQTNVDTNFVIR